MTGLIILAAGASSRLGQPKQNLIYNGKTLLQHAIDVGLASQCTIIIVVLGASQEVVQDGIINPKVNLVVNENWKEGMAASIKQGVEAILEIEPLLSQVIIMPCDQPYVDVTTLKNLISAKQKSGKMIAACAYDNTYGTPVLFDRSFFSALLTLKGQKGAKQLVMENFQKVVSIPFPLGSIDIDTQKDYEKLSGLNDI